jgi:hypothetical protein
VNFKENTTYNKHPWKSCNILCALWQQSSYEFAIIKNNVRNIHKAGQNKTSSIAEKNIATSSLLQLYHMYTTKKVHEKDIDVPSPAGVPISPNRHRRPSITSMGMHQLRKVIYDKECSLVVKQVIHNDDALFCIVHILFRRCTYTL